MMKTKECLKKINYIILVAGLIALFGCGIEEPKAHVNNVHADEADVDAAIISEIAGVSILSADVGQMVEYEQNYRAEVGSVVRVAKTVRNVISKEVTDLEARVVMREDYYEYDYKVPDKINDEKHSDVIWTESTDGIKVNFLKPLKLIVKAAEVTYEYFNLEVNKKNFALPEATKARPDCGGFNNCSLPGTQISYLRYTREDGKITKRIQFAMVLSKEIPPLLMDPTFGMLPVLNFCILEHYADQVLLNSCLVLRDVKK